MRNHTRVVGFAIRSCEYRKRAAEFSREKMFIKHSASGGFLRGRNMPRKPGAALIYRIAAHYFCKELRDIGEQKVTRQYQTIGFERPEPRDYRDG